MEFSKSSSEDREIQPLLEPLPAGESCNRVYMVYFVMGVGFLFPFSAFITAIDYFAYIYPGQNINRKFPFVILLTCFVVNIVVVVWARKSDARIRINLGIVLFMASLLTVPIVDLVYVRGRMQGLDLGYRVTFGAVVMCGAGTGLVQSGLLGSAGELPKGYMQAVNAGMGASGVLVSITRIVTKAIYPHDANGLSSSTSLYFMVGSTLMVICLICYNISNHLALINHYKHLKMAALDNERKRQNSTTLTSKIPPTSPSSTTTLWRIIERVKWMGLGKFILFVVTLSIFPGCLTEDVHSQLLEDWYPILLITIFNISLLAGMAFPSAYFIEDDRVPIIGSVARLVFYPLFYVCLHGPRILRTEISMTILTCLMSLTNGYCASLLLILAPKAVPMQHSETAGIVMAFFSTLGQLIGTIVAWLWVI